MMFSAENYKFILEDCTYALAAGFILSFINEILNSLFYKTKINVFIKDILFFIIFAVILFSYVVSFANYPVLRWYHTLFCIIGFIVSRFSFAKILRLIFDLYLAGFYIISSHLKRKVKIKVKFKEKLDNTKSEKNQNLLKSNDILLYNE